MSFQSVLSPQIIFFHAENAIFTFRFATLIGISFAAEAVTAISLLLKYVCFKNHNILMHDKPSKLSILLQPRWLPLSMGNYTCTIQ